MITARHMTWSDMTGCYEFIKWMGVPEKVVNVLSHLMKGWKTRLEVTDKGETKISRWIKIRKGFLQGDSYFPVGFCLTEVPITMMLEETDGYKMGQPGPEENTQYVY